MRSIISIIAYLEFVIFWVKCEYEVIFGKKIANIPEVDIVNSM